MLSQRLQRQVDSLLDQAEAAVQRLEWNTVKERCEAVLRLDPDNADAQSFLDAASRDGALVAASPRTNAAAGGSPNTSDPPLPMSFAGGRYLVRRFLGEGAKKRVYLAHDTKLDRDVAFALIKTDGLDADGLVRVRREAQAMGRLGDNAHIVTIHDTGDEAGAPFIVSQHMAGGSVEDLLAGAEQHRIPRDRAMTIAEQVCLALQHAHERGIIHRDLKPGNVWLSADGNASLGDFGLAIALDRSRVTMAGMMVGTVAYMAPEQALGRSPDARSDLYALGAMLYEMISGRPPFLGDDAVGVISQHINTAPVAPSWHEPSVSKPLEALILRLLAKSPDDRPAAAKDVAQELRQLIERPQVHSVVEPAPNAATDLRRLDWGRFVGRREEMEQLKASLENALSAKASIVFIAGEPGIGKTRLADEFAVYAGLRGAQVLTGRCYDGDQSVPYRPFVDALKQYARTRADDELRADMGSSAPELATMVSEVRQRFPDIAGAPTLEPEAERLRLFDSIISFLRNAAQAKPLVLFFDDLHWADKPSLLLLQHVARHAADARVLIVATYRDVDLDRSHPLGEALEAFRRVPTVSRIALRGLPEEQVDHLLAAIEPSEEVAPARRALAHALWQGTEGNPFFVQEILAHLVEEGKLRREDGRWTAGSVSITSLGIPEGIRQVIGRRLSHVSDDCQRVLTRLSTMAHGFTWEGLRATNGELTEDRLLDLLDEALATRILTERRGEIPTTYDFAHALIRQTLYEELSGPRRVLLHRQIGLALEELWANHLNQHVGELAYHFYHAAPGGDVSKAIDYCMRAGDRSAALYGWEDAASHYERALMSMELSATPDDERRSQTMLVLGETCMRAGDRERGRRALVETTELARRIGSADTLARAALAFGSDLVVNEVGRTDEIAVRALEDALGALGNEDSYLCTRVLARLALELAFSTERQRAELLSQQAIEMATRIDAPRALASALIAAQWVAATPHKSQELLRVAEHVLEAALATHDVELEYMARRGSIVLLLQLGRIEDVERALAPMEALCAVLHQPFLTWGVAAVRAMLPQVQGRLDEAERFATDALLLGQQAGAPTAVLGFAAQMLITRLYQGRLDELEPAVMQFSKSYPTLDIFGVVLAWIHSQQKAPRDVVSPVFEGVMSRGISSLAHDQLWLARIGLLTDICTFLQDVERAEELYSVLLPYDGCTMTVEGVLCFGSVSRYLGSLATLLQRWDDAERHFHAALTADRRLGPPLWVWTVRYFAAMLVARDAAGDGARALELVQEALETAQQLGMKGAVEDCVGLKLRAQRAVGFGLFTSIDRVADVVQAERRPLPTRAVAPDGTVTILFSDIEDSTGLTERLGDQYWHDVLRQHNAILRHQISTHDGYEVKTMGDGFMVAFQSAKKGLDCAISIQRAFNGRDGTDDEPLKVRIGLHAGEAIKDGADFYGKNVVMAARVAGKAIGGEILVSSLLRQLVESSMDPTLFGEPREVELKGLSGAYTVYAVTVPP